MSPNKLLTAFVGVAGVLGQLHVRAMLLRPRADPEPFQLFAYGGAIGGLPVFYQDGAAVIVDSTVASESDNNLVPIAFTANSDTALSVAPNTTAASPPFSNATFFVPATSSSSHSVGFANGTAPDDAVTRGFGFFGHNVFLQEDGGSVISLFGAVPSATDGIWTLEWNAVDTEAGAVPVTLKDTPPPNRR